MVQDTMNHKPSHGSHGSMQGGAHKSSMKLSGVPKKETKKSVNDYNYYLRSAKQASNYEMTTEYLTNYIIKCFEYGNDISEVLRELEYPDPDSWRPTMQQSAHPGNDPANEAQGAFKTSNLRLNSSQSLMTFISADELWTIISQKLMHFLWECCTNGAHEE
jgi:hypothetical protein